MSDDEELNITEVTVFAGGKRQFQQYEPDEVQVGMTATVEPDQNEDVVRRKLSEKAWASVEYELARRKEQYVRKDE